MSVPEVVPTYVNRLQWGPIIAGGLVAAAVSSVLLGFVTAGGFSLLSTAPTWRDASFALWLLAGLLLVIVSLLSFGLGGYVAGRFRIRDAVTTVEEVQLWDGIHGFLAWAIAVLLAGVLAIGIARLAAPAAAPGGGAGPAASVGGENLLAYEIDQLFRSPTRRMSDSIAYSRAEAGRILLTTASHNGMTNEDRGYLADVVAAETGLAPEAAFDRVNQVAARSQDSLARARRVAVLTAFMTAAALLLGAACAWLAACAAGRDRERTIIPRWFVTRVRTI